MIRQVTVALLTLGLLIAFSAMPLVAQDEAAPVQAPDGEYQIDPPHTSLYFHIEHLGISQVYGRFNDKAGTFTLGQSPTFAVDIDTASIDTGVEQRDNHLRSPDFFDARQYPRISFKSTSVEVEGNQYKVTGDFSMHGQTREITLPLTLSGATESQGKQRAGFVGNVTIDRRDWGISGFQGAVGNDVHLMISFEGILQ